MRSKQYFTSIKNNPHEISTDPDFSQYLVQQCKQSHCHLSGLLMSMFALLPICQVRLVDIIVLCSHSMLTKLRTDTAPHLVCSPYTFPKQLHVSWKAHQAFIAAGICIDSIKVLHVRLPCICKYLLLLLNLQFLGQFYQYAVDQLVVCQLKIGRYGVKGYNDVMDKIWVV